jgi:hypothetical protein
MTSRISYNIHAQALRNHDRLIAHLKTIQPTAVLVMDGLGLAKEIKAAVPNTTVIHREYPDDDIHTRVSPEDWLKNRQDDAQGGIYQYTTNEAGFGQNLIDWHVRLMELAAPRRVPLVIGNMSVGTPQAADWKSARKMIELLDKHRDLFVLGLHEYACGVVTSGYIGGYPDNAGVEPKPENKGKGRNLIPSANWPAREEAQKLTMFHMGRFKFLLQACQDMGIKPPRIILTEHGFDDVSDIKPWAATLVQTPPYQHPRGWKSLLNQWSNWYSGQGWSPQRAMFEQLAYADHTIYQGTPVEAQLIFCWGHTSDRWDQFDVAEAATFHTLLEEYAAKPTPLPAPPPAPVPVPPAPVPPPAPTIPANVQLLLTEMQAFLLAREATLRITRRVEIVEQETLETLLEAREERIKQIDTEIKSIEQLTNKLSKLV